MASERHKRSERDCCRRVAAGLAPAATPRHERRRCGHGGPTVTSFARPPAVHGKLSKMLWARLSQRMNVEQRSLFAIHLLTASGAAFSLLAVMAIAEGAWNRAFVWLGIALLVDGVDGPLARRHRVRERLPKWD